MKRIIPELMVDDVRSTTLFYKEILGFDVDLESPEQNPSFAKLSQGEVTIMLYQRDEFVKEVPKFLNIKLGGSAALFIEIEEIEKYWNQIKSKVKIIQKLYETGYGTKEFSFEDCNGYVFIVSKAAD